MSKTKTFLTDSQPGYVLSMFLLFWLISAWTFLKKKKKKGSYKKKKKKRLHPPSSALAVFEVLISFPK